MMDLSQFGNLDMMQGYLGGMMGLFFVLALVDTALKGWGMWRAARMNKLPWFIAMLVFNTLGILPAIFLLITNEEYKAWGKKEGLRTGSKTSQ